MWRSRLYSDIRIALTGNFSSTNHESATAIFSSHRFILVSRSPYFYSQLITYPSKPSLRWPIDSHSPLSAIHPRLTPLYLGYIYTGTLVFSQRLRPRHRIPHHAFSHLPRPRRPLRRDPSPHRPGDDARSLPRFSRIYRIRTHHWGESGVLAAVDVDNARVEPHGRSSLLSART
jgi:hypothetical protein